MDDLRHLVDRSSRDSQAEWQGDAADAFRTNARPVCEKVSDVQQRIAAVAVALTTFSDEIEALAAAARSIRIAAGAAGLATSGDRVFPPSGPASAQPTTADALTRAYELARASAHSVREDEVRIHNQLEQVLAAACDDGWFVEALRKAGLLPPDNADPSAALGFVGEKFLDLTGKGLEWGATLGLGRFAPRVKGRFVDITDGRLLDRLDLKNWVATSGKGAARTGFLSAGKIAGHGAAAVGALVTGLDQWQQDAQDPTMDDGERLLRAGGRAAVVTAASVGTVALVGAAAAAATVSAPVVAVGAVAVVASIGVGFGVDAVADHFLNHSEPGRDIWGNAADALTFWN
ncbi:MAG: hypothetical protein ACXVWZ_04365 [Nocardioides sp.]